EPVSPEHENAMKFWNEGHKLEQQFKFGMALEKYNKSLEREPQNKFALFDKAKMYLALGDKKNASEILNKMVQSNIRKDEAGEYITKYCGKNIDAAKFFNELKSTSFFNYAMDDIRSERYEAALRKLDSSLKYTPDYKNALFNKAEMHKKLNQQKAACATWKKLLELTPGDNEVAYLLKQNCN
ncbi:MAG: tetratricopeptide repeat protein, partial [Bacteroidia bacterium]